MTAGPRRLWLAAVVSMIPLAVEAGWAELVAGTLVLGAAALLFDRFPVVTLSVLAAAAAVPAVAISPLARAWPVLAIAAFGYLAGRWTTADSLPASVACVGLAALPVSMIVNGVLSGLYNWFVYALLLLVAVLLPWLGGRYRRQRAELVAAGWERAALLERQQQLEIGLERARIARDMHDSLGHEWGLIALRAAALEVSADLPERQRQLAGELRADVATATERLREIIGMLDSEPRDVAGLVERAVSAGMTIEWEPPTDLPVAVEQVAYRVVQEGLTNAAKHAPGATVTIRFEGECVTVANGPGERRETASGGTGIAGLRERVQALGGTLTAGPRNDGWALSATLPPAPAKPDAQRGLARAVRVPALVAGVLVLLTGVLYFVAGAYNRLDPAVFERIPAGAGRAEVERLLPAFQILGDPDRMPAPEGAECTRYWATEQRDDRLYFRLCFAGDRLVLKEVVPR